MINNINYSKPKRGTIEVSRIKTVSTPKKQLIKTDKYESLTKHVDGEEVVVQRPVYEEIVTDGRTESVTENLEVWEVEQDVNGVVEVHKFKTQQEAKEFYRSARK